MQAQLISHSDPAALVSESTTQLSAQVPAGPLARLAQFMYGGLAVAMSTLIVAAVHPELRSSVRGALLPEYRKVLSTARGDLMGNGTIFTVAKIKTRDSLSLEVYELLADGGTRLTQRVILEDKRDGYFNFNGQATNLAIDDINQDGRPEILAPSFDQNLVGHLNILTYSETDGFVALTR